MRKFIVKVEAELEVEAFEPEDAQEIVEDILGDSVDIKVKKLKIDTSF